MRFTESELKGAYTIDPDKMEDERGFFARMWCSREFDEHNLKSSFAQINQSFNRKPGIIRGLHYQAEPYEEAKLFRCIRGEIFSVIIDLRVDSATYLQWSGFHLTAQNRRMLYVPENFANGYQALVENTEVIYLTSQFYYPDAERGIRFDDPIFNIVWPQNDQTIVSKKDLSWTNFQPLVKSGSKK
jgi:dTDP-4-dehydrorhamnose 3,5-epimerase